MSGSSRRHRAYPTCLILAPTRELASQIHDEGRKFTYATGIATIVVYGCADIRGDAAHVLEVLRKELVALSDWSLYRQDVLSRTLSWSNPCHTDESFWRHAPAQTRPSFVGGD